MQKVLGIDPGYGRIGFGVIAKGKQNIDYINHGCIETSQDLKFSERLEQIDDAMQKIIAKFKPDVAAIEKLYFSKNVKTAIDVGQARGVILLTMSKADLILKEYTPNEIKQAVTGKGNADKRQVQEMVKMQLDLSSSPSQDDAADALAIAVCFANRDMNYMA